MAITGRIILPGEYFIIEEDTTNVNKTLMYRFVSIGDFECVKHFCASFPISGGWPIPLGCILPR